MDLSEVKTILIDFDGVLTDGRKSIDHEGKTMFKHVHSRDNRAIRELVALGYEVVIISADKWDGTAAYAQKLGCEILFERDKSNLPYENYIAIGDDAWDRQMLMKAKKCYCPLDADISLTSLNYMVILPCKGGEGVIAYMITDILSNG